MFHLSNFLTPHRALSAVVGGLCLLAPALHAANTASDNGADPAYANGWNSGTNGGTGFNPWVFNNNNNGGGSFSGEFIGNSQYTGGAVYGNGNRIGIGTSAFGMYSDSGSTANALRSFTGGALSVGQTVNIDMSTGYSNNGSVRGFQLLTSSDLTAVANGNDPSATRFQYIFVGGQNSYQVNSEAGATAQATAHGFTDNGMHTSFTLTSPDTFTFSVTFNDNNTTETFNGALGGNIGDTIDGIRLFDYNAGGGSQNDMFFNNLSVTGGITVPEPETAFGGGLCIVLVAGGALLRRRGPVPV